MSSPAVERFTVGRLLEDLLRSPPAPADPQDVEELVGWFTEEATARLEGCPPEARPLRLPKQRIESLLACETMTIAQLGPLPLTEALVRGRCTDLQVAQHVTVGLTADVEADVRDALGHPRRCRRARVDRRGQRRGAAEALAPCRTGPGVAPARLGEHRRRLVAPTAGAGAGGTGGWRPAAHVHVRPGPRRSRHRPPVGPRRGEGRCRRGTAIAATCSGTRSSPRSATGARPTSSRRGAPPTTGSCRCRSAPVRWKPRLDGRSPPSTGWWSWPAAASRRSGRTVAAAGVPSSTAAAPGLASLDAPRTTSDATYLDEERDWLTDDELGW